MNFYTRSQAHMLLLITSLTDAKHTNQKAADIMKTAQYEAFILCEVHYIDKKHSDNPEKKSF